ncbi:MAG TPA: hypothetical protein VD794_08990 [Flavisolibacter sp.]|nr:hypothetical protein [Flavisolibacter sp.]
MTIHEFRTGNYIIDKDGIYAKIWKLNAADKFIYTEGYDSGWEVELLNPIPLTPELLEKAGFEKKKGHFNNAITMHYYNMGAISLMLGPDGIYYFFTTTSNTPLPYLHQLQNLVFALTGKELTINL